jgi:hypothetical protein
VLLIEAVFVVRVPLQIAGFVAVVMVVILVVTPPGGMGVGNVVEVTCELR